MHGAQCSSNNQILCMIHFSGNRAYSLFHPILLSNHVPVNGYLKLSVLDVSYLQSKLFPVISFYKYTDQLPAQSAISQFNTCIKIFRRRRVKTKAGLVIIIVISSFAIGPATCLHFLSKHFSPLLPWVRFFTRTHS